MAGNKPTLVKFNIQNAKYALKTESGYGTPVPFGTSQKIALEADMSKSVIFGDGKKLLSIILDKGKTGTLTLNNICQQYEIDMGRKKKLQIGVADIKTIREIPHAIYIETCGADEDSKIPVAKTWIYNVTSTRPAENYDQTTDDINASTFDIPLEIRGVELKNAQNETYIDADGNIHLVYQLTVEPGEDGYDDFGLAVPIPKAV